MMGVTVDARGSSRERDDRGAGVAARVLAERAPGPTVCATARMGAGVGVHGRAVLSQPFRV